MKNERIFIDEGSLGKKLSEESEEDEMKTANPSDERKQLKRSAEKEEHSKKRRIKKVLVANRGEIAVRIIRTLRDMGIKSVAIFSDVDRNSLHATMADESICVGARSPKDSYLNKIQIINAALVTGADAIHPGFGFLSENSSFAKMCEIYGIKFIGPSHRVMSAMADKDISKKTMRELGIPVIDGSDDVVNSLKDALKIAEEIGYPVMIKARAGGGGKGMRIVNSEDAMEFALTSAKKEAENAFGNGEVFIEKYIKSPRHIEVQILGDEHGNVIHLGCRDCSLQLNHQKIIEEAPPVNLSKELEEKLCKYAVKGAKEIGYYSAGTMEFLVSGDNLFFLEMNTRIQVEHPVTEMITGIDIVRAQINIAEKKKLKIKQENIKFRGHAIECRINACNVEEGFTPSIGKIKELNLPGGYGIRVDSGIYQGYDVLPFYDSMLMKIIAWGENKKQAMAIMSRALEELVVGGVSINNKFNGFLLEQKAFAKSKYTTSDMEEYMEEYAKLSESNRGKPMD